MRGQPRRRAQGSAAQFLCTAKPLSSRGLQPPGVPGSSSRQLQAALRQHYLPSRSLLAPAHVPLLWGRYVQGEDLEFFKDRVERPTPFPGCGDWELVMAKDFGGGVRYSAWKRHLAVRPSFSPERVLLCWDLAAGLLCCAARAAVSACLQVNRRPS